MTDIHTHILPKMDDGSSCTGESLKMIALEQQFGINTICLTPHFYASQNSPAEFLRRRTQSWSRIRAALPEDSPRMMLGAEVQYFEGISRCQDVSYLRLGPSGRILIEMPFAKWDGFVLREIYALRDSTGLTPVLAHVDRYFRWQPIGIWKEIHQEGLEMQLNCDAFSGWKTRFLAEGLVKKGFIQYLGSDCHNMQTRKPNWDLVPEQILTQFEANH